MKTENKDKLQAALSEDISLTGFQSILREVLVNEINTHPELSDSTKSYGLELTSIVSIPIETGVMVNKGLKSAARTPYTSVLNAGIVASTAIATMMLLKKTPAFVKVLGALTGGVAAGVVLTSFDKQNDNVEVKYFITSTMEEIESKVDKLISLLEVIDTISKTPESNEQPTSSKFGDSYANIINWLQNLYLESESYGNECAKSIKRQIERILKTVYCDTVHYDGKNDTLFEFNDDSTIMETSELFPAIVAYSGKVYPGLVSKPSNN